MSNPESEDLASPRSLSSPRVAQVSAEEKQAVENLPHLYDRIEDLGLTQEYCAYRDRFLEWRKGEATGAAGELEAPLLKKGFNGWYPNANVWTFRRTLSYWISVGFFEGSLFFTISSFVGCYPDLLGSYTFAMTKGGYLAGKFFFIVCTYFMCVEAVNLRIDEGDDPAEDAKEPFYWWPFYYRTAVSKLEAAGAGPVPYFCAVSYFIGCLTFGSGMVAEFAPLEEDLATLIKTWAFIIGSFLFVVGGICELHETGVFRGINCSLDQGAALLNTIGSAFFLYGSMAALWPGPDSAFVGSFTFGIGSVLFVIGSGALIVMWKDEQFGLTFFSAINHLISPQGKGNSLSLRGAVFVMIYCTAGAVSIYDFMLSLTDLHRAGQPHNLILEHAFNALLPSIIAHLILTLTSAMLRAPKEAPFRQIYFGYRVLAVIMIVNSTAKLTAKLSMATDGRFLKCDFAEAATVASTTAATLLSAARSSTTVAA